MATIYKPSAASKKEGIKYPDRVIIANFSHGRITIQPDGTEKTFVVPPNIKIKRAWASVPGVCNFITSETNAKFANKIINSQKRLEMIPFDRIDEEFREYLNSFKDIDSDTRDEMNNMIKRKNAILKSGNESEIDFVNEAERYVHNFDKFFQLSTYLPGDTVIDKQFSRTNAEAINKGTAREWVMLLVNVPGIDEDLITHMVMQTRGGKPDIYFSEIINYLKDKGVKEVIFFDNSCSTFMDKDENEFDDRFIRARRRALLNPSSSVKFGGKKVKKSYKKRKTNKKNKKSKKRCL